MDEDTLNYLENTYGPLISVQKTDLENVASVTPNNIYYLIMQLSFRQGVKDKPHYDDWAKYHQDDWAKLHYDDQARFSKSTTHHRTRRQSAIPATSTKRG